MVVGTTDYPKWLNKQLEEYGAYINILVTGISKNHICWQISFGWPIRLIGGYTGSVLPSVYPLLFWNIHMQNVNISQHSFSQYYNKISSETGQALLKICPYFINYKNFLNIFQQFLSYP